MRLVWVLAVTIPAIIFGGMCAAVIFKPADRPSAQILVSGVGSVTTMPDRATVTYGVRGEGVSAKEALAHLHDHAASVDAAVTQFLHGQGVSHVTEFSVIEVRSPDCNNGDANQPHLSTEPCAVLGYVASQPVSIQTSRVADAGTLVGVIANAGGITASIQSFWLADEADARRRAMMAAMHDAREQATRIADASGAQLGSLIRAEDASYHGLGESRGFPAQMPFLSASPAAPVAPPALPPPFVKTLVKPEAIYTRAEIMVVYAVRP